MESGYTPSGLQQVTNITVTEYSQISSYRVILIPISHKIPYNQMTYKYIYIYIHLIPLQIINQEISIYGTLPVIYN